MPESPLIAAGAQIPPTSAAPLHTNEWFTGMWTQGNPLGSGAVPFLYQKFYSAMRYDRLVGGKNTEVTSRLSLARRPGSLIYNSVNFPPISRFYEFRAFQGGQERIHILADVEGTSFGPATLTIASVQVGYFPVGHGSFEWLIYVVFTSNLPPLQSGQTYTFSGVTNYPALNSQTLTRVRFGPGGNDCYFESSVLAPYGPAADTGNAVVTNAVLFGGSVRDVTGPSTDLTLWNKDQSAGRTSFQSVGNIVFFGDGVNANKWVTSALQWIAATSYSRGNFFVDPNNNMQLAVGSQTSTITDISVTANVATVFFSSASQLRIPVGTKLTFAGCTTIAALNGTTKTVTIVENGQQVSFALTHADLAFSVETGTATTGTGITGSSQPTWATGFGAITQDGGEQWENRGTSVEKWGIETPATAPIVTQATAPSIYPAWAANTWYAPLFVILDSNGNLQQLTTAGTTGAAAPTWTTVKGNPTAETSPGTAIWTCMGAAGWVASATHAVGDVVQATFTYYITVQVWVSNCFTLNTRIKTEKGTRRIGEITVYDQVWNGKKFVAIKEIHDHKFRGSICEMGNNEGVTPDHLLKDTGGWIEAEKIFAKTYDFIGVVRTLTVDADSYDDQCFELENGRIAHNKSIDGGYYQNQQQAVTATGLFLCVTAGTSAATVPAWSNGLGTVTEDNTVVWQNQGAAPAWPGATQTLSLATKVLDSAYNVETVQKMGKSGATAPAWNTESGGSTTDNTLTWLNDGSYSKANTGTWQWAYSGKNSITGDIGTASPISLSLLVGAGNLAVIQGAGLANDKQIDTIVIWRTLQGGSTLIYDDEIPNPAVGSTPNTWIYTDTNPDGNLNELITAPVSSSNDPPPIGFRPMAYYLNRIWGFVANRLVYSGGPAIVTGSGDESFPPLNNFALPSLGVACWPTSIGLIVYTNSDVWVVMGQGTSSSPFYVINFQAGIGLAGQDALTINGSTAYGMLTSGQVVSMDPGAGELEVGFPIGDQFDALYTGSETYMAYHPGASADAALYVADGAIGWFRMAAVAAPESGNVWSPRAIIEGGVKAIASLEIAPGMKRLLLGPAVNGPILMRDKTVSTDNGTPYEASAEIGSIVMAQPGTTVGVQFITTEEAMLTGSSRINVGIMLDEIAGVYDDLKNTSNDPPNQPRSTTIEVNRFWAMQNAQPVTCRHMRVELSWKAEDFANELFTYTIYGRLPEKARK